MTENLRKELAQNEVLTPATSDVLTDVTVGAATQPYNQASTDRYDWGVAAISDFSEATVDRWLSRSTKVGSTWSTETNPVQGGLPDSRKQDLTGEDQKTGVFYNWYTATAGTGTWSMTTAGTEASSSVCPAGWQLPRYSAVNGTSTLAPSGSWMHLIRDVYGVIKNQGDQSTVTDGNLNANAELHAFPISLPYSGVVGWQSGGTEGQGANGNFWSAGAPSQITARNLNFNGTSVWPETTGGRLDGFSIRCVANDSTPGTLTVTPDSIDADTATTVDVSLPLSGDYNANISLGDTALTCSRTSTSPLSFSCSVPSTTSGTYTLTASLPSYGKTYTGNLTVETPGPSSLFDLTTMQELADYPTFCADATTPNADATLEDIDGSHHGDVNYVPTVTLTDDRTDGTANTKYSYRIRKLADGKCWMTQNLRLTNATLTSDDSNLTTISSYVLNASSTSGWCTSTGSSCINTENVLDSGNADYGVYYSWASAIAGTPTAYSISTQGTLAPNSICPKGWHLPSSYITNSDFQTLYNQYNSAAKMRSYGDYADLKGPAFVLSGSRYGNSIILQDTYGYYWSSTASYADYAYDLVLYSSSVSPADYISKNYGLTVRCVAE